MTHILLMMNDTHFAASLDTDAKRGRANDAQVSAPIPSERVAFKTTCVSEGDVNGMPSGGEEVRMHRVEALRAAIAAGTYHVSAADLADKLLQSMQRPCQQL